MTLPNGKQKTTVIPQPFSAVRDIDYCPSEGFFGEAEERIREHK